MTVSIAKPRSQAEATRIVDEIVTGGNWTAEGHGECGMVYKRSGADGVETLRIIKIDRRKYEVVKEVEQTENLLN